MSRFFKKTVAAIALCSSVFFSFGQADSLAEKEDSLYISYNFNVLGIPQGEFGIGFEIIFKNLLALEFGFGKTWETYHYSIFENRKTYAGYLGDYEYDNLKTNSEGSFVRNWTANLCASKYFHVSRKFLPFIAAEYKWKNVFSVISHEKDPYGLLYPGQNLIYGRQHRTSNKFSIYGGISTNRKFVQIKVYAGVFLDNRDINYPLLILDDVYEKYSFQQERFIDRKFGIEVGLKIGLGIRVTADELIGNE